MIDIAASGQTIALAARDSGIFVSTNNGAAWQRKIVGMEGLAVTAIVLTAQDKLYASTEKNGVFTTTTGATQWTSAAGGLSDLRLKDLVLGPGGYLYAISDSGALCRTTTALVAVEAPTSVQPEMYSLHQNYPNPFNPSTVISFHLPVVSPVRLVVFDLLGREMAVLVNERREAGVHEITLDASRLSSGVYFYRLHAGDFVSTKRMVVLK